jgi:hypothetical protein
MQSSITVPATTDCITVVRTRSSVMLHPLLFLVRKPLRTNFDLQTILLSPSYCYLRNKSGNACYHSEQNLLSSSSLSKHIKIYDIHKYNFVCCFVWV